MKWFQKGPGAKPLSPGSNVVSGVSATAEVEAIDEAEQTERTDVPEAIENESTPFPVDGSGGRSASGRRLTRTVASPIPAMLAESMGLAEEPPPPATPVALTGKGVSRR